MTGASRGIGEACASHLNKIGFRVFAGVRHTVDGTLAHGNAGACPTPVLLDVTDPISIATAANLIASEVGEAGLAGLVNNAGIVVAAPLEFLPIAELRRQLEVNVIGQIAVTQAFLPLLRKRKGRIVFLSSISGRSVMPLLGPYAASKFALEALADALRMELLASGLSVSIIEPGSVTTPLWENSIAAAEDLARNFPPEAQMLYGRAFAGMKKAALHAAEGGVPVEVVVRSVAHALTASRPKTRDLFGRRTRLQIMLKLLPDRLRDKLLTRYLFHYSTD